MKYLRVKKTKFEVPIFPANVVNYSCALAHSWGCGVIPPEMLQMRCEYYNQINKTGNNIIPTCVK